MCEFSIPVLQCTLEICVTGGVFVDYLPPGKLNLTSKSVQIHLFATQLLLVLNLLVISNSTQR